MRESWKNKFKHNIDIIISPIISKEIDIILIISFMEISISRQVTK